MANYYKFDLENSVNKSFSKISRGWPPGPTPLQGRGDPLPRLPPFGAMRLSETYGFI